MTHRLAVVLVLIAAGAIAAACSADDSASEPAASPTQAAVHDPAQPGPHAVGVRQTEIVRASTVDGSPRHLETWIWYPAAGEGDSVTQDAPVAEGGPFPIVVYSHGSGGRPDYQRFLTQHLASWGFVVVAPSHPGNTSEDCFPCDTAAVLRSARERPDDVRFALDELTSMGGDPGSGLEGAVDGDRVAIVGHSFGGWTALYVAPDGQFDAVVAQAPAATNVLRERAGDIGVPLMIIASTYDDVVPISQVEAYWAEVADIAKEFVLFPEGVHLNYVDRCFWCRDGLSEERGHKLINRYTTAWLLVHVIGDQRYADFLAADPPDAKLVP